MKLRRFKQFDLNEDVRAIKSKASELKGEVTLYRLTSHSVVDLEQPGEYYVCNRSEIDPELLENSNGEMFLITINCDSSNIDLDKSEKECARLNCDYIVAVKDDKKCKVVTIEPYKR